MRELGKKIEDCISITMSLIKRYIIYLHFPSISDILIAIKRRTWTESSLIHRKSAFFRSRSLFTNEGTKRHHRRVVSTIVREESLAQKLLDFAKRDSDIYKEFYETEKKKRKRVTTTRVTS